MSFPTAEMWPPSFEVAVMQSGLTAPAAGSDAVVFSTTIVLVRLGVPSGSAIRAAAM